MIQFFFENTDEIALNPDIKSWLKEVIISENKKPGILNFILCDDAYLLKINRQYLQHDYFTDIISFDYTKGNIISGDIFISLQRISENASQFDSGFEEELKRVLVHGILHLCGYHDKTEAEINEMRSKENYYLKTFPL